ncbi:flagellar hook-length control protein FliK [Aliiroseovarius sp. KMU-50]|uniref:Flagellar hook-length control protein FliK n=1 Tax=Aliiroseovarius salicola TaxID=3009082 RepID=A0ABT4W3K6_9RHOB|nr:flagellar hook-length control protein FliK [Aliiroseovarius sp. KMU-50]MDA5095107.1 flagellar hook-length control protein FliK [Aliiroseovarius sp. KMU-50]
MQLGPHFPLLVSAEETPTLDRTSESTVEVFASFEALMQPLPKGHIASAGIEKAPDITNQEGTPPVPDGLFEVGEGMGSDNNIGLTGVETGLNIQLEKISSIKDFSTLIPPNNAGSPRQLADIEIEAALKPVTTGSEAKPNPNITPNEMNASGAIVPSHEVARRQPEAPSVKPAYNDLSANLSGEINHRHGETAGQPSRSGEALGQGKGLRPVGIQPATEAPDLHKISFPSSLMALGDLGGRYSDPSLTGAKITDMINPSDAEATASPVNSQKPIFPQTDGPDVPKTDQWSVSRGITKETRRDGAAAQTPVQVAGDVGTIKGTGDYLPLGIPMISAIGTESGGIMTPNPLSASEASQAVDASVELISPEFSTADFRSARADILGSLRTELPRHIALQLVEVAKSMPDRPVELTLTPEELGRLRLTFSGDLSAMAVTVNVERPETLELMKRHIEILAQEMREIGYEGVSFSFEQSGAGAHGGGSAQDGSSKNDPQSGAHDAPGIVSDAPSLLQMNLSNAIEGIDIRL